MSSISYEIEFDLDHFIDDLPSLRDSRIDTWCAARSQDRHDASAEGAYSDARRD